MSEKRTEHSATVEYSECRKLLQNHMLKFQKYILERHGVRMQNLLKRLLAICVIFLRLFLKRKQMRMIRMLPIFPDRKQMKIKYPGAVIMAGGTPNCVCRYRFSI